MLKKKNRALRVMVSLIGRSNENSTRLSRVLNDVKKQRRLVVDIFHLIDINRLDGIDLYWENPEPKDMVITQYRTLCMLP